MKDKENQIRNEIKQDFKMQEEKHKQIEEMAKECKNCIHENVCGLWIVQENCKHYQPKLPEDSVVNTPTIQCETYSQNDMVVLSIEEIEGFRKDQAEVKFLKNKIVEQASKETAEKIIHLVGMIPIPRQVSNRYGVGFENALTVVKLEIAKQFGVEIKE